VATPFLGPALEAPVQATPPIPRKIRWKNDQPVRTRRKITKRTAKADAADSDTRQAADIPTSRIGDAIPSEILGLHQGSENINEYFDRPSDQSLIQAAGPIAPWLAPLSSQTRMLMSHCKIFSS
jgi:hypothetical protein